MLLEPHPSDERRRVAVVLDEVEPERNRFQRREPQQKRTARFPRLDLQPPLRRKGSALRIEDLHVGPPAEPLDAEKIGPVLSHFGEVVVVNPEKEFERVKTIPMNASAPIELERETGQ